MLNNIEKRILYERFKLNKNFAEISRSIGKTRERVRQIAKDIARKTKNKERETLSKLIAEKHDFAETGKICLLCNMPYSDKGYKFCNKCKEANKKERKGKYKLKKDSVYTFRMSKHKPYSTGVGHNIRSDFNILYECPCVAIAKFNHHFDYAQPKEIIRLCASCHRLWHNKLESHNHGHINGIYSLPGTEYGL